MPQKDQPSRRCVIGAGLAAAALAVPALAQAKKTQIFGVGGGFLVQPWEPPLLQKHLLSLSPARSPKVCYLGAATGDNPAGLEAFSRQMEAHDCRLYHFNIFAPATMDFAGYLQGMDIIYVGGGSTRNLIALWREWHFDQALKTALDAGVVLAGESAGLICWYQSGLTDSNPLQLMPVKALGFIPGSACPHYDQRFDRPSQFRKFIADGSMDSPGLALDQHTAVHYIDGALHEIVTDRKGPTAHRLTRRANGFDETPLPVRLLGS